ncbi:hypothetical protein CO046_01900 [Candidatus Peregrinibacteria bacterium CG_4_9_14_0_2_um_filter_53_11]|nr:MAG: hypothetical protein CO046_01900 [Candidatus Peregrinibacteria bacterium CG_4_9_14_0_2_um_filter_53_11]
MCARSLVSIYPEKVPFPVYCADCWWSDRWNPLAYGREYDFSKTFFQNYAELQNLVPRLALYVKNVHNAEFNNHSEQIKECYLTVDAISAENVYYSNLIDSCSDVADCMNVQRSQLCYENLQSRDNYNCIQTFLTDNCRDSAFLYDCKDCSDCFMSSNLRHKRYYIFNRPYTKEAYEEWRASFSLSSAAVYEAYYQQFLDLIHTRAIRKAQNITQCENCFGDFIEKSKNVHDSYSIVGSEDCRYCYINWYLKDCYDTTESAYDCELQYESHGCNRGKRTVAAHVSYDVDAVQYVDSCHNSSDLFGCISLRRSRYALLNKVYPEEEYRELRARIIQKMREDGEYGEFFPTALSPYPYNDTVAHAYYPLTREEAVSRGYAWSDSPERHYLPQTLTLPDQLESVSDGILNEILVCSECAKNYKIIEQELKLYRQLHLSLPRRCADCRYKRRLALCNPHRLWARQCSMCRAEIQAPYPPQATDLVYCESCYQQTL